jgi:hypothetical protein
MTWTFFREQANDAKGVDAHVAPQTAPVLVGAVLATMLSPVAAHAKAAPDGVRCWLPESNAEALVILSNYYPGYWWDHTDLTVYVQAQPGISEEYPPGD